MSSQSHTHYRPSNEAVRLGAGIVMPLCSPPPSQILRSPRELLASPAAPCPLNRSGTGEVGGANNLSFPFLGEPRDGYERLMKETGEYRSQVHPESILLPSLSLSEIGNTKFMLKPRTSRRQLQSFDNQNSSKKRRLETFRPVAFRSLHADFLKATSGLLVIDPLLEGPPCTRRRLISTISEEEHDLSLPITVSEDENETVEGETDIPQVDVQGCVPVFPVVAPSTHTALF